MLLKNFAIWLLSSLVVRGTSACADDSFQSIPLPTTLSPSGLKEIKLAQFLKNLEFSFFTAGSVNISEWGSNGYSNNITVSVDKIATQNEIHLRSLNAILDANGEPVIPPCGYSFPVNTTNEFLNLAKYICSLTLGATIGLSERVSIADPILTRFVSSMLSVESRHDAYLRAVLTETPFPAPFDTCFEDIWAYNLALSFVVPGSCPVGIGVQILPRLEVRKASVAPYSNTTNGTALYEFTWDPTQSPFIAEKGKQLFVGWVNQVNMPYYTPLMSTAEGKGTASIPQGLNGILLAVITNQQYISIKDLAPGTMAGPVLLP